MHVSLSYVPLGSKHWFETWWCLNVIDSEHLASPTELQWGVYIWIYFKQQQQQQQNKNQNGHMLWRIFKEFGLLSGRAFFFTKWHIGGKNMLNSLKWLHCVWSHYMPNNKWWAIWFVHEVAGHKSWAGYKMCLSLRYWAGIQNQHSKDLCTDS